MFQLDTQSSWIFVFWHQLKSLNYVCDPKICDRAFCQKNLLQKCKLLTVQNPFWLPLQNVFDTLKTKRKSKFDKDLFEANQDVDDTNKGVYCLPLWHYWRSEQYMYERNQNPLWFLQNVFKALKTERKSEFDKDLFEANQDVDDTNKGVYCPNLVATIKLDPLNNLQDGWHH